MKDTEITVIQINNNDNISLTDMVKNIENGLAQIEKWLRNKNTIEFLGICEEIYYPHFNSPKFVGIKNEEQKQLGWTTKRELAKLNYHIHTDAIKHNLVPLELSPAQTSIIYANESDVLNAALFGITVKQWRDANPDLNRTLSGLQDPTMSAF